MVDFEIAEDDEGRFLITYEKNRMAARRLLGDHPIMAGDTLEGDLIVHLEDVGVGSDYLLATAYGLFIVDCKYARIGIINGPAQLPREADNG